MKRRCSFQCAGIFLLLALCLAGCVQSPEAKSARYIENGKKLLKTNEPQRAILEFLNAANVTPRNEEAYYQLGVAYIQAGDIIHGVPALRKVLELNPKHQAAQLILARLMSTVDDKKVLEEAEQRLESLVQDAPDSANALQALALTELKLGNAEDAISNLGKALASAPGSISIAVTLAQAKLQQRDVKGAEEVLQQSCANNPKSVAAVVILGRFYMALKRTADAEQQFQRALAMDGNSADAIYNVASLQLQTGRKQEAEQNLRRLSTMSSKTTQSALASYLFQEGRTGEALAEFQRLYKEDPNNRITRTRLIAAYASMNRLGDAENVLNDALKKNPKDLDALLQRGELLLDAGKYNRAENDLNEVLHLQPISPEVHFVLARLYRVRGQSLRYREELTKAIEMNPFILQVRIELAQTLIASNNPQNALELLNKTPESQKNNLDILAQRNWALWAAGEMSELRKGIDAALARQKSPEFLLQDGLWKLRSGNPAGARAALEAALNLSPGDVRALGALNQTFVQQNQSQAAVKKVEEFASKQPKSAPVQDFLGVLLLNKGDVKGARVAFEAAKAADPKFLRADLALAATDVADRKYDDALNRLNGILTTQPDDVQARLWLGNVKMFKRDYNGALEAYSRVVRSDFSNPTGLNNYAFLLAQEAHKLDEALKYAQRAQELEPDNPEFADTLGWILFEKGLYQPAIVQLARAGARDGNVVWKYHLAMAYAKTGDVGRGREILKAALARNPDLPEAKAAKEMLGVSQ
jgi:putative PEP-CTERM system TPR-repeat lipoprotein